MNSQNPNPRGRDFIPRRVSTFIPWANSFYYTIMLAPNLTILGISVEDISTLETLFTQYSAVVENFPNDPTSAQLEQRRTVIFNLTAFIRYLVRFYVRRPGVPSDLIIALGIHLIDNVRTAHTVVRELVDFVFTPSVPLQVTIDFWVRGVDFSKAKPLNYDGAVFIWKISDEMPLRIQDYNSGHRLASRRIFRLPFDNEFRGRRVWFRSAWQNKRGILGEYSAPQSTVIP